VNQREAMKRLLERSSLGTPGARSLRARTDPAAVRRVMERAREVDDSTVTLAITCEEHSPSCECLVEFFSGHRDARVVRLDPEANASTEPTQIGPDLRAALETLRAAGLEPRVTNNRRSALPGRESKAG
jgi:hypothetical protein